MITFFRCATNRFNVYRLLSVTAIQHCAIFQPVLLQCTTISSSSKRMTSTGAQNGTGGGGFQIDKDSLRDKIGDMAYHVTQERGTERPFSGVYCKNKEPGTYRCIVCDESLFQSNHKFDSGCGWPSFWDAADKSKVKLTEDISHGMKRTEVTCANCGAHLGHLFDDGPQPSGQRYCINSASLKFEKKQQQQDKN